MRWRFVSEQKLKGSEIFTQLEEEDRHGEDEDVSLSGDLFESVMQVTERLQTLWKVHNRSGRWR